MLIQKLRLQRGWSQQQLADLSGLSARTIQRLERGQPPSVESLKALASVFEIDFSTLKEPSVQISPSTPNPALPSLPADELLALQQVRRIKGFYVHLTQYLVIVLVLAAFNFLKSPDKPWVIYVALGWGFGILMHGLRVFNRIPFLDARWEARQVEKLIGRRL